jgi:hypothetical protein
MQILISILISTAAGRILQLILMPPGPIKAALAVKMKSATHLLVLVGALSSKSKWMNWEIDRAKQSDVRLKLAAVRLAKDNTTPSGLLNVGTAWATSFERDRIVDALKAAKAGY